jgi:predicted nucleotide-binding protein
VIADRAFDYRDVSGIDAYLEMRAMVERVSAQEAIALEQPFSSLSTAEAPMPDPRDVFVIHGPDAEALQAVESFLRDLDLHPMDWDDLVQRVGKGSPYTGEVVDQAFKEAQAVIGLMTPDDEVLLHPDLQRTRGPQHERVVGLQARPNVLIELGMALGTHADRTIIVEIGDMRPSTDLDGRNVVRLDGSFEQINRLKKRLETAHCAVRDTNPNWARVERFQNLRAAARRPSTGGGTSDPPTPNPPSARLVARVERHGTTGHRLIVRNVGDVRLHNVSWDVDPRAGWSVANGHPSPYPIPVLGPGHEAPMIIAISQTTKLTARVDLHGTTENGEVYNEEQWVSV